MTCFFCHRGDVPKKLGARWYHEVLAPSGQLITHCPCRQQSAREREYQSGIMTVEPESAHYGPDSDRPVGETDGRQDTENVERRKARRKDSFAR